MFTFVDAGDRIKAAAAAAGLPAGRALVDDARSLVRLMDGGRRLSPDAGLAFRAMQVVADRNPVARAPASGVFRSKSVRPKRGKGSYSRKGRGK